MNENLKAGYHCPAEAWPFLLLTETSQLYDAAPSRGWASMKALGKAIRLSD